VQLGHAGLAFEKDKPYTISLMAKADAPRSITLNAMQAHEPWRGLWSAELKLTTDWQPFHFTFQPGESDKAARITLTNLGAQAGSVAFAAISLRPGGRVGLAEGERLGRLAPFTKGSFSSRTPAAQRDWIRFLWDTEARYWTGMERFLKDELGVKSLVVGTQMGWSPFTVQEKLDVIDSHSYWQHPHFPGRAWDMDNWTVQNISMAADPNGGTLPHLANSRVAGKPFICTEYNHSAPNTYAAETALLIASFAAMQDWDGVFLFAYSHRRDEWNTRKIPSFFDIDQHPGKMATLPAAAAMFLRGDVQPALEAARRTGPYLGADRFGAKASDALTQAVAVALRNGEAPSSASASASQPSQFHWNAAQGKKYVTVDAPRSKAAIGFVCPGKVDLGGGVRVEFGKSRQDWAALAITALDGPNCSSPGRILIVAVGDCENTAMSWKDDKHTSVARDWGRAPSLVEGIAAKVALPVAASRVRAWPLDDRGQRKAVMKPSGSATQAEVTLAPGHQTLWYEVEIGPAP
jgi:carbohydrate binding protein with CBM4/9 domain